MEKQVAAGLIKKFIHRCKGLLRKTFGWLNKPAMYLENRIYDTPINNVNR